jgi:hypothetical protein
MFDGKMGEFLDLNIVITTYAQIVTFVITRNYAKIFERL